MCSNTGRVLSTLFPPVTVEPIYSLKLKFILDRAVAHVVCRCLPTGLSRIRGPVCDVGFVVDKAELGQVFSKHCGFLCQLFQGLLYTQNHPSSAASKNRPNIG
jgi:hypothetical protein